MGGANHEDMLSNFESLLERMVEDENRPMGRYSRQRVVERHFGYDLTKSFTIRCPRCQNRTIPVMTCRRCDRIGIVGVITVTPDRSYL